MDDDKNILAQAAGDSGIANQRSKYALVSFVLANIALGSVFVAQFVPVIIFLFLLFPAAILYGHMAKREIGKDANHIEGVGMANYGLFVGYFCLFLAVLALYATVQGFRAS